VKPDLDAISRAGCTLCFHRGYRDLPPCEVHHKRGGAGAGRRGTIVMGLCPEHHRGQTGLHGMGRKAFERHYGVTEDELAAISAARAAEGAG
jgi:hypothetical protein